MTIILKILAEGIFKSLIQRQSARNGRKNKTSDAIVYSLMIFRTFY